MAFFATEELNLNECLKDQNMPVHYSRNFLIAILLDNLLRFERKSEQRRHKKQVENRSIISILL